MPDPEPDHSIPRFTSNPYEALRDFRTACSTGNVMEVNRLSVGAYSADRKYYLGEGLKAAIIKKQLEIVRLLLEHGAQIDAGVAIMAVKIGYLPMFRILVEYGWDVNTPLIGGATALHGVIQNEELARWLLSQGANPNLGPPVIPQPHVNSIADSGAILGTAAAISNPSFFDTLIHHGAKLENSLPLHTAAAGRSAENEKDRIPMMEHLLQLGVDINGSDGSIGMRAIGAPLHAAIVHGALENVRFLLLNGADAHKKCRWGIPALALAKQTRREDMVTLIDSFLRRQGIP